MCYQVLIYTTADKAELCRVRHRHRRRSSLLLRKLYKLNFYFYQQQGCLIEEASRISSIAPLRNSVSTDVPYPRQRIKIAVETMVESIHI